MATNGNLSIESITAKITFVDPMVEGYHAELLVVGGEKPAYIHASASSEFPEAIDFSVTDQPLLPLLEADKTGDEYAAVRDAQVYFEDLSSATESPYLPIFKIASRVVADLQGLY